jgi:hypothetical protein
MTLYVTGAALAVLLLAACNTGVQENPVEIKTRASQSLSDMISTTPSDFTWEYFQEELVISGKAEAAANVELRALRIAEDDIAGTAVSSSVELSPDELDTGVPGNSWVPGDSWVPGNEWFPGSQWNPQNPFTSAAIAPLNSDAAVLDAVQPQLAENYNPKVNAVITYADGAEIDGESVFAAVLQRTS